MLAVALTMAQAASAFYDANLGRWITRDPLGEPGFEANLRLAPWREPGGEALPAEVTQGPNLYTYVGNNPINAVDPLGLAYGNPVSGPSGPVGPSGPYGPGGCSYKPPAQNNCVQNCLAANGGGWALGALGLSSGTVGSVPKLYGGGALGAGRSTTAFSYIQHFGGPALRNIGRQLNPYGRAVQCAAGGYLVGAAISCACICASDPDAY